MPSYREGGENKDGQTFGNIQTRLLKNQEEDV